MADDFLGIGAGALGITSAPTLTLVNMQTDPNIKRDDFTLSFVPGKNRWISWHSYAPGQWIASRQGLLALAGGGLFRLSKNAPGVFLDGQVHPSRIDAHFAFGDSRVVQSFSFRSQVTTATGRVLPAATFTGAMVYNAYQASGMIPLQPMSNLRRVNGEWRFNGFRDLLKDPTQPFLQDGWLLPGVVEPDRNWMQQKRFVDAYAVLRLESDNTSGNSVSLHQISVHQRESNR